MITEIQKYNHTQMLSSMQTDTETQLNIFFKIKPPKKTHQIQKQNTENTTTKQIYFSHLERNNECVWCPFLDQRPQHLGRHLQVQVSWSLGRLYFVFWLGNVHMKIWLYDWKCFMYTWKLDFMIGNVFCTHENLTLWLEMYKWKLDFMIGKLHVKHRN